MDTLAPPYALAIALADEIAAEVRRYAETLGRKEQPDLEGAAMVKKVEELWGNCFGWPRYRRARVALLEFIEGMDRAVHAFLLFDVEVRKARGLGGDDVIDGILRGKKSRPDRYRMAEAGLKKLVAEHFSGVAPNTERVNPERRRAALVKMARAFVRRKLSLFKRQYQRCAHSPSTRSSRHAASSRTTSDLGRRKSCLQRTSTLRGYSVS
jgi:hypothetical protein